MTPLSSARQTSPLWRIITAIPLARNVLVFLCIVFAGIAEGFGIATVLPLIAVLGDDSSKSSALSTAVLRGLDALHLPHQPELLLGIIAAGMLLKAGLTLLALRQVGRAVADVVANIRLDLIDAVLHARWNYYVHQPIARFPNALGGEAGRAGDAYNAMTQMFSLSVQALVYLGIATVASWKLALLALLTSIVMIVSLNRLLLSARGSAGKQTKRMSKLLARLTDVLAGIKPMKAMARQARFSQLFLQDLTVIKKTIRKQVFAKNTNRALQEPILALCLVIGIYFALKVFQMPVAEVVIMGLLLAKTVSLVGKAQQELQNIFVAESGFMAVCEAVDDARAAREISRGSHQPTFERDIEFRDVSFAFGPRRIVSAANFRIAAGEVIALTGSSGAGKTTLVDLLLGLQEPDTGEIRIDGHALTTVEIVRWRSLTGYVPQELMLFHDTIVANITLGQPEFTVADAERALRQAGAWEFISELPQGINTVVGERGALLSGGQRQRVALARALVHSPRLLILDESTSALDPATEALIVVNVCRLARETGLTVLSISHHQAWVDAADRVLKLEKGILRETTAPLKAAIA